MALLFVAMARLMLHVRVVDTMSSLHAATFECAYAVCMLQLICEYEPQLNTLYNAVSGLEHDGCHFINVKEYAAAALASHGVLSVACRTCAHPRTRRRAFFHLRASNGPPTLVLAPPTSAPGLGCRFQVRRDFRAASGMARPRNVRC